MAKQVKLGVAEGTRARLQQLARELAAAHENNRKVTVEVDPEPINPLCCGVSMDALLTFLLDQYYGHKARNKRQLEKAREARAKKGD